MSTFIGNLDTRVYEPGEFVLLQPFGYRTRIGGLSTYTDVPKHHAIIVPRGFITDFASIPRIFRWAINPNGASRWAAVIHDFGYCSQIMTRAQYDAIFLEALEVSGVGWAQRHAMYAAVRAGGWIYWNKRSKNRANQDYDFVPESYWDEE